MEKNTFSLKNIFNRNSILGRLLQWYALILLITLGGIAWIYSQSQALKQTSRDLVDQHQSINSYALKLESGLSYLAYLHYNYTVGKNENLLKRARGIWEKRMKPDLDSLKSLTFNINKANLISQAQDLEKSLNQFEILQQTLIKNQSAINSSDFQKLDKDFDLQLNKIRKQLSNLAAGEETALKFAITAIQNYTNNLFQISVSLAIFVLTLGFILLIAFLQRVLRFNQRMNIHIDTMINGNIPKDIYTNYDELKPITVTANEMVQTFIRLRSLATEVGEGNFRTEIRPFRGRGVLGASITKMRDSLYKIAQESAERIWFNEGFAKFAEILRTTSRDSELFYDSVISNLVKYLGISQGGIFAIFKTNSKTVMELKATYAYDRKKFLYKEISQEEGLVGQAWREKDLVHVTEIPEDYGEITSGLGHLRPKSILIIPLISNDEVLGILELASFEAFQARQIEFVKRISESVAATIARLQVDIETKRLLGDSQEMAERMLAQEEEMRQSMEELVSTQEKMEQTSRELESQLKTLNETFIILEINPDGFLVKVNEIAQKLYGYLEKELIQKHFTILLGSGAIHENVERDWRRVLNGNILQGDFIRFKKTGERVWLNEIIYPIFNNRGQITKIFVMGYDITRQKEQEKALKIQVNELQMSKRDVVNRIREIESKSRQKIQKIEQEYLEKLKEKERAIAELSK
jgi:PAS domain S-box-containing protein